MDDMTSGVHTMEAAAPIDSYQDSAAAPQEQNVPLSALKQEREMRQKMQEELSLIKDHLSLMQAQQRSQAPQPKEEVESMTDNDVMTYGEFKKISQRLTKDVQMSIEELRITQKYPDYQQVITQYLPDVLKKNPSLQKSLAQSQDYELAYYLARESDAYKSSHKSQARNADAERIINNAQSSGSLSSVGGSTPISQAKRYKTMSDAEFRAEMNRNMGNA